MKIRLTNCCDYCEGQMGQCINTSCPCHSSSSQEKKWHSCRCITEVHHSKCPLYRQPSAEWEKEFDALQENFRDMLNKWVVMELPVREFIRKAVEQAREEGCQSMYEDIYRRDIVQEIRTAALKEVMEMIEGMKENLEDISTSPTYWREAKNKLLDDLKQSITKLTEQV